MKKIAKDRKVIPGIKKKEKEKINRNEIKREVKKIIKNI